MHKRAVPTSVFAHVSCTPGKWASLRERVREARPGHTQHTAQPAQPSHHYQRTITAASPTSHTTTTVRTLVFTTVLVHSAEKMRLPEGARGERSPYHLSVCAGACPPECLLSGDSQRVRWCSLKSGASASNCTAVASLWVNSR